MSVWRGLIPILLTLYKVRRSWLRASFTFSAPSLTGLEFEMDQAPSIWIMISTDPATSPSFPYHPLPYYRYQECSTTPTPLSNFLISTSQCVRNLLWWHLQARSENSQTEVMRCSSFGPICIKSSCYRPKMNTVTDGGLGVWSAHTHTHTHTHTQLYFSFNSRFNSRGWYWWEKEGEQWWQTGTC